MYNTASYDDCVISIRVSLQFCCSIDNSRVVNNACHHKLNPTVDCFVDKLNIIQIVMMIGLNYYSITKNDLSA